MQQGTVELSLTNKLFVGGLGVVLAIVAGLPQGLSGFLLTAALTTLFFEGLSYRKIVYDSNTIYLIRPLRRQTIRLEDVTALSYDNVFHLVGGKTIPLRDQRMYDQTQLRAMLDQVRRRLGKQDAYLELRSAGLQLLMSGGYRENDREFRALVAAYDALPIRLRM